MSDTLAWVPAVFGGVFGLLIGSFLNVVIYRTPQMMQRQWTADCAELAGKPIPQGEPFNLMMPRSRCQNCGHQIRWFENIPILSWLALRGKCSSCKTSISARYPAIELVTGLLFAWCAWHGGFTWTTLVWCLFCALLISLAMIDLDTTLLPDDLTYPLLWAGLVAATLGWIPVALPDAIWGAVAGYMSLWMVYWGFKLLTGKEGMGRGDFKLLAALGAWFGWQALVPIVLMASCIGAVVGIVQKLRKQLQAGQPIPFGPFLAGAGFTALIFGPQSILRVIGL